MQLLVRSSSPLRVFESDSMMMTSDYKKLSLECRSSTIFVQAEKETPTHAWHMIRTVLLPHPLINHWSVRHQRRRELSAVSSSPAYQRSNFEENIGTKRAITTVQSSHSSLALYGMYCCCHRL